MMTSEQNSATDLLWIRKLFGKSVLARMSVGQIVQLLTPRGEERYLLVNGSDAEIALQLCELPGSWQSLHADPAVAGLLGGSVLGDKALPVKDASFDAVVVHDVFERRADPQTFIAECHRVLKDDGRLILNVPHAKKWSLARGLAKVLGLRPAPTEPTAAHFTASTLFDMVKDGFDVETEKTYARFGVEFTESVSDLVATYAVTGVRDRPGEPLAADEAYARAYRARTWFYPLQLVARGMDALLFWTSGHYLVSRCRRRVWRPRRTPRLQDGRSIADATINTKIGTAGPLAN